MSKDQSEPAFPFEGGQNSGMQPYHGMTLRDYFAAKTMQGWVSDLSFRDTPEHIGRAVTVAYRVADAMLAERAK